MTIHNVPMGAGGVGCIYVIFFLCIVEEAMPLSLFYYCTCIYVLLYVSHRRFLSFNPSLCCLLPLLLFMLLFQGHVACGNFIVIGLHSGNKFCVS